MQKKSSASRQPFLLCSTTRPSGGDRTIEGRIVLTAMQVTPYWTTGNGGVEMKAMAGMKKKEVPTSENLSESWYFKVEKTLCNSAGGLHQPCRYATCRHVRDRASVQSAGGAILDVMHIYQIFLHRILPIMKTMK